MPVGNQILGHFSSLNRQDIDRALEIAEAVARNNAPIRSGRLRRRIRRSATSSTNTAIGGRRAIPTQGRQTTAVGTLIADTSYAGYQEFGTRYIRPKRFLLSGLEASAAYLRSQGYR